MNSKLFSGKNQALQGERVFLCILLVAAFWLRFRNLGALGLYGDEDFTFLAVKGILENGYPIMPSGMFYPRGILFSYFSALSAYFFGLSEFSIRLPSVVFSLLILYMVYTFVKEIFGSGIALATSAVYSFSAWDIEMARFARMYETFLFFYLFSAYSFHKGFIAGKRIYRILTPPIFFITMTLHSLGVFLLIFFACPFLIKDYSVIRYRSLFSYAGLIAVLDYFFRMFEGSVYNNAILKVMIVNDSVGKMDRLLPNLTYVERLFSSWHHEHVLTVLVIILLCIVYVTRLRYVFRKSNFSTLDLLVSGIFLAVVFLQQYGLGVWIFAYYLFVRYNGFSSLREPLCRVHLLFLVLSFFVWFAWGVYEGFALFPDGGVFVISKRVFLSLIDYPFMNVRVLLHVMPLMTVVVLCGLLLLFDRASRSVMNAGSIVIMIGFIGPLTATGFFKKWPYLQYLYMVYPFFVMTFVWFFYDRTEYLLTKITRDNWFGGYRQWVILLSSIALIFASSDYHSISQAISISERKHSSFVKDVEIFEYMMHPDHKSAALYVKNNMEPQDIIIAIDNLIAYVYTKKIDYMLRTEGFMGEGLHLHQDIFLGTPIIRSLEGLKEVIESRNGNNVWLITSHEFMGPHLKKPILDERVTKFLEENAGRVAYTAEDSITQVFLWQS